MCAYLYPSPELGLPEPVFELKRRITRIGRHPNNDVSLLLESVSRFHAQIELMDAGYILTDLGSSNGTFLNGERLASPRPIQEKDVITFGRADFIFSLRSPEERADKGDGAPSGKTHTSSVNIVGDDNAESTILSTKLSVEATPVPGSELVTGPRTDAESLKRATQRLLTLYKLGEVTRSAATREEMLSKVMDLIFQVLPADRGVILTVEPPDEILEPQLVRYRRPGGEKELTISRTIVQKCLEERVAVLSRDAKIDSRFNSSESIIAGDIRSTMCVPMVSKRHVLGVIFLDTRESVRAFTEDDLAFASSIANDLAMNLENLELTQEMIKNERLAAVGQTIAGLAHNIKNILQLAKGGIELMDGAIARSAMDDVSVFWPVVRRGIDRMQSLTQEMLDYSRQTRPELYEANVNDVIEELVASFQRDRVDAGVDIDVELSPNVPPRRIDPDGLFKSLMNLLSNAVDAFEGRGGRIMITTQYIRDTIYIAVEDNGRGIPKDKQLKIFQPFFTTKGSKGTGLGLSMTKKYIEDMGGTISVESEEGQGTSFTIALPPLTARVEFDVELDDGARGPQPTRH